MRSWRKVLLVALLFVCGKSSLEAKSHETKKEVSSRDQELFFFLEKYARECSSVTELAPFSIFSSALFQGLQMNPGPNLEYLNIQSEKAPFEDVQNGSTRGKKVRIRSIFWHADDRFINIEPTDLLFIDSRHTYVRTSYVLEKFSPRVKKYIILNGTSAPFGNEDEPNVSQEWYPGNIDRYKRGTWLAVFDFLQKNPEWVLVKKSFHDRGFTILKRTSPTSIQKFYDEEVEKAIQKKMVLCTGPSLRRLELLKQVTEADMSLIPFKKIFFTTNDPSLIHVTFNGIKPQCELIPEQGWQLDCTNCIIRSFKIVSEDPTLADDDIVLFKHESVFINDMELLKKAVSKLVHGYDMVARLQLAHERHPKGTDVFFIKVSAIRKYVKEFSLARGFSHEARFCEEYIAKYVTNTIPNMYLIPFHHSNWFFTELGFYHIPRTNYENNWMWDQRNYQELFK